MSAVPAALPGVPPQRRRIAVGRAAAAVLWAIVYLFALRGHSVAATADIPRAVGILLAVYPVIDAVAAGLQWHLGLRRSELAVGILLDIVATGGLLVTTFGWPARTVLVAFGAWAAVSGLWQLAGAWRAGPPRGTQLPLLISGGLSTVAGVVFVATASQLTAGLSTPAGYAVLGAVLFATWSLMNRRQQRASPR